MMWGTGGEFFSGWSLHSSVQRPRVNLQQIRMTRGACETFFLICEREERERERARIYQKPYAGHNSPTTHPGSFYSLCISRMGSN